MQDSRFVVLAVHGFLGQTQDWTPTFDHLKTELPSNFEFFAVDYMKQQSLNAKNPFDAWAKNFKRWSDTKFPNQQKILMGYSLGGRLVLHALQHAESSYHSAILISANPGTQDQSLKEKRVESDRFWSDKFKKDDFQKLIKQWNDQTVFQGSVQEPERKEADYNRELLGKALTTWSLGIQADFRPWLQKSKTPILWVAGERDEKFVEVSKEIQSLNPKIEMDLVENSSHRVIFDNPQRIGRQFLSKLI